MAVLILNDTQGREIGRRDMAPAERFELYTLCADHGLLAFANAQYRVNTVAWRVPDEQCVLGVTFDHWDAYEYSVEC